MRQFNFRKRSTCNYLFQWHISMRHKQTEEHKISHVWSKSIFKVTLRVENIGQKYSIYITSIKFSQNTSM